MLGTADRLLAARLPLAPDTAVAAIALVPAPSSPTTAAPDPIELARRRILASPASPLLSDALLPSVELGHRPALHVFVLVPQSRTAQATAALDALCFDGLTAPTPASHFPFRQIYDAPRHLVSHFLNAVRIRLIDDIVAATDAGTRRCTDGFLIAHQQPNTGTDWGTGWEYKALSRPLIFCHIQLQPTHSALVIRPTLLPTPYLPLDSCLPLPPRSPILLLPYATPAYFLTTYSGPTSALVRQFADSLRGQGLPPLDPSFIIGWIGVENKQGEDKGIIFIYPTRLCLAFVPSLKRPLLDHIPDLPGPLQLSPRLQTAVSPLSEAPPTYPHRPSLLASPTTELRAFRALTLSKSKNIRTLAAQVSGYVDHVAKDRERERERLKREREGGNAGSPNMLPRTTPSSSVAALPSTPSVAPPATAHTPLPAQPSIPSQNFYPSPPQAEPSAAPVPGNTSPILPMKPDAPTSAPIQVAPPLTASSSSSSSSYDPFGYLGMNISDMNMDFGIDMGMTFNMGMSNISGNTNASSGGPGSRSGYNDDSSRGIGLGGSSGMDFEEFTDDDFNFFDQPSAHASTAPAPASAVSSVAAIASSMQATPPSFGDIHLSGPGPPLPAIHAQPTPISHTPWTSNFPEGFTPCSIEHLDPTLPPELVSSSPGLLPPIGAERDPLTPNIHLEQDTRLATLDQRTGETRKGFEPIPFAKYHRVADGKYGPSGKFGLPSPPPDEPDIPDKVPPTDSRPPLPRRPPLWRSEGSTASSWRMQYNAATDPRVGVMRKLIGVKRKHTTQGGRTGKDIRKPPWITEYEEWKVHLSPYQADATNFDSEPSEDEDGTQSESGFSEGEDTPATSRPNTPLPSYLPLGPSLLHTHFHHAHLLPLSKPLRPPGSSISGSGGHGALGVTTMPIVNVPTPVSPAAGLGLTAEKWRALEIVVNVLAKEAVENTIWGEAWLTNNISSQKFAGEGKKLTEVWASDIKFVEKLLGTLEGVQSDLTLGDFFGLDLTNTSLSIPSSPEPQPLQVMHTPKVSVGKGDTIINIIPSALRFWEKLGLRPKSGEKDASVYVLFADDGEQYCSDDTENWLASVCTAYQSKHLGKLTLGTGPYCVKDGLVPLRFDLSFRKHFATFVANLTDASTPTILFLVVPIALMSLSSPLFRRILLSVTKALNSLPRDRVFVQLMPEHVINYMENDPARTNQLDTFCINLYNRITVPVDRPLARSFAPDNTPAIPSRAYLQRPTFTLTRPVLPKVIYTRSTHTSLGVLDRYTLLHVGYRLSSCGKWLVAACVDQRGEACDQKVWLVRNDQQDSDGEGNGGTASTPASASGTGPVNSQEGGYAVKEVWEFVMGFAKRADVEWRIVISKLGIMDEAELTAWTELLPTTVPTCGLGSVHVSLTCADLDNPWMLTKFNNNGSLVQSGGGNGKASNGKQILFSDASSTTYALFPSVVLPIAVLPTQADLRLALPYVVDPSNGSNSAGDGDLESTVTSPTIMTNTVASTAPIPTSPSSSIFSPSKGPGPHTIGLLPESTTCLVRIPSSPPLTSISMLHIHFLYTYRHPLSTTGKSSMLEPKTVHADVTKNFYELSVLAKARWKVSGSEGDMDDGDSGHAGAGSRNVSGGGGGGGSGGGCGASPILPIHLAMVEVMSQVAAGAEGVELDS